MIMAGKGLFIVMSKISPDKEEEFNRWYNEVHLPYALERLPMLSGRRYKIKDERTLLEGGKVKIEEPEYQYMAVYEFESYEIMQEALNSGKLGESVKEYNEKFGDGGRHHIRGVEIKSLFVG